MLTADQTSTDYVMSDKDDTPHLLPGSAMRIAKILDEPLPESRTPPEPTSNEPTIPPFTNRPDLWISIPVDAKSRSASTSSPTERDRNRRHSVGREQKKRRSQRIQSKDVVVPSTPEGQPKKSPSKGSPKQSPSKKSPKKSPSRRSPKKSPSTSSPKKSPSKGSTTKKSLSASSPDAATGAAANTIRIRLRASESKDEQLSTTPSEMVRKSKRRSSITGTNSGMNSPGPTRMERNGKDRQDEEDVGDGMKRSSTGEKKRRRSKSPPAKEPSPSHRKVVRIEEKEELPTPKADIVNNEYCSACSGGGSLICCESCPKSFHFTCADPPIDPDHVPDEHWFCNECRAKAVTVTKPESKKELTTVAEIWNYLLEKSRGVNPRVFTVPKRIRKINLETIEEEHLVEPSAGRSFNRKNGHMGKDRHRTDRDSVHHQMHDTTEAYEHGQGRHRDRLVEEGHCHVCNKTAVVPSKMLIKCDSCSLVWHLDCLPYPLAVYPSSHRHWSCPIHMTADNLNGILPPRSVAAAIEASNVRIRLDDWPRSLNNHSDVPQLPEASVRLQFGWSAGAVPFSNRPAACTVPEVIRSAYSQMRQLPHRQIRLLAYYDHYSYVDADVETNLVI